MTHHDLEELREAISSGPTEFTEEEMLRLATLLDLRIRAAFAAGIVEGVMLAAVASAEATTEQGDVK